MKKINPLHWLICLVIVAAGCDKSNNPVIEQEDPQPLSAITVTADMQHKTATIQGNALEHTRIQLKYKGENGSVLRVLQQKTAGTFEFEIDMLPDFEQSVALVAERNEQSYLYDELETIPAYPYAPKASAKELAEQLMAGRWKSNQSKSRIIKKQTAPFPPYDMFATVAEKIFDFKADDLFLFTVVKPVAFTHNSGSWTMDADKIMTIHTHIPLGPMSIEDIKIHALDAHSLSLFVHISDGIFLLVFDKEK